MQSCRIEKQRLTGMGFRRTESNGVAKTFHSEGREPIMAILDDKCNARFQDLKGNEISQQEAYDNFPKLRELFRG